MNHLCALLTCIYLCLAGHYDNQNSPCSLIDDSNMSYFSPDTFRVISKDAEDTHDRHEFEEANKPSEWRRQWLEDEGLALPNIYNKKTEVLPHSAPDFRINKPHPGSCGFLRHNVRLLNEPICSVYTDVPADGNQHWWPSRVSNEPLQVPPRTNDTIYRVDFIEDKHDQATPFGSSRHTSNPNKEPALGTGTQYPFYYIHLFKDNIKLLVGTL